MEGQTSRMLRHRPKPRRRTAPPGAVKTTAADALPPWDSHPPHPVPPPRLIALHEAAHAILAVAAGIPVRRIVCSFRSWCGTCGGIGPSFVELGQSGRVHPSRLATAFLAAREAEALEGLPEPDPQTWIDTDRRAARTILERAGRSAAEAEGLLPLLAA